MSKKDAKRKKLLIVYKLIVHSTLNNTYKCANINGLISHISVNTGQTYKCANINWLISPLILVTLISVQI